jgi:UDP-N-acetylmuramoyl-L-alanyl-D-glutamate--2,6-diaminopimelate ligase
VTPELPLVPVVDVARVSGGRVVGDGAGVVRDAAHDTRDVRPGCVFFCVPGSRVDGHLLAGEAIAAGAAALVVERVLDVGVPQVVVGAVRAAMGPISALVFGRPADGMGVAGITGTNGKTTVTYLLESIAARAGRRAGLVGTTGALVGGAPVPLARTTPEAPDLFRLLATMRAAQVEIVALEVSSHALHQHRVDGLVCDVAVFTNLSQDHLDYHPTMEDYYRAKRRLFGPELARAGIVGVDDAWGRRLAREAEVPVTTYALDAPAQVRPAEVRAGRDGTTFVLDGARWRTGLLGRYNAANAIAAILAARVLGLGDDAIAEGLAALGGVPGRAEPVDVGQDFLVVVDYAHTPDSIHSVLGAVRPLASGRVIVVFGCGGDRDHDKRSRMGRAAVEAADLSIITTDNPRSEDPQAIIREVERGAAEAGGSYVVEPDRRAAIALALRTAGPEDAVVIAGKGHEAVQELGDRTVAFDDRQVAREELSALRERS